MMPTMLLFVRSLLPEWRFRGKGFALLVLWKLLCRLNLLKPVVVETAPNVKMRLDLNDRIQWIMFWRLYDVDELNWLLGVLQPGDVFLDIGGNVGFYAVNAAYKVGDTGQVHVVEPVATNCDAIAKNVELNRRTNVTIHPVAASNSAGHVEFFLSPNSAETGWGSIYRRPEPGQLVQVRVPTVALDALITDAEIRRIRAIKLDIEGHELQALEGMSSILSNGHAAILCELNSELLALGGHTQRDIIDYLRGYAYLPFELHNHQPSPITDDTTLDPLANVIFMKLESS